MITTEQFSRKLLFVILSLVGLTVLKAAYPIIATVILNKHDTAYTYSMIYFAGNMLFGIVLISKHRMSALNTISLLALALFYPVFAALFYLLTLVTQHHE